MAIVEYLQSYWQGRQLLDPRLPGEVTPVCAPILPADWVRLEVRRVRR
jgi:hypothetical protein